MGLKSWSGLVYVVVLADIWNWFSFSFLFDAHDGGGEG